MKKVIIIFLATFLCTLFLIGCSSEKESYKVYSFSGENDSISLSNGMIVLDDQDDICYGGSLQVNKVKLKNIVSYATNLYLEIDGEKEILLSNCVEDISGEILDTPFDIGKVSGDVLVNNDNQLNGSLWVEFKTTNVNGDTNTYKLKLEVIEITKKD